MEAFALARWQTWRATLVTRRASGGCSINCSACATWLSDTMLKYGDCPICAARPLPQRPVEDGIAGHVREIRDDDRILLRHHRRCYKIGGNRIIPRAAATTSPAIPYAIALKGRRLMLCELAPAPVAACCDAASTEAERPESVSRCNRFRSARISEAC